MSPALRAPAALDDPVAIRRAGRELLSLALIDARNHLLARLAVDESPAALRRAAHAGWYQEHWIACHVQRNRGEACEAGSLRLAGIEPAVAGWLHPQGDRPEPDALRAYLAATLEVTLDLLATATEDDAALHFYRQALQHEDRLSEALDEQLRGGAPAARPLREPLWLPARRWLLGSEPGGFVPPNERWAHEVAVPECEIDAQPVSWAQYLEFVEDGGYDRTELWSEAGRSWLAASGRRAPAFVEQLRGGVVLESGPGRSGAAGGKPRPLHRAAPGQPVMHVTRFEAEAWCAWAGRRLPTEPEWEMAAATAASRGFAWGEVFEWVAGSARAWPGAGPEAPGALDRVPGPGAVPQGVLRGGSFATRSRWRHPKARRFVPLTADHPFVGFRSCTFG